MSVVHNKALVMFCCSVQLRKAKPIGSKCLVDLKQCTTCVTHSRICPFATSWANTCVGAGRGEGGWLNMQLADIRIQL